MENINNTSCRMCGTYELGSFETLCPECKRTQAIIDASKPIHPGKQAIIDICQKNINKYDTLKAKAEMLDGFVRWCNELAEHDKTPEGANLQLCLKVAVILAKAKELQ